MIMTEYALRLLSPCFNGGAQPMDLAELRVPSIRGQIRWWFRESASSSSARQQEEVCFMPIRLTQV